MFKKLLLFFCFSLILLSASASIYLVEPLDGQLSSSGEVTFGKIAPGETLKVVVKKKSDFGFEWNSLSVDAGLLPPGWSSEFVETDKTLIALVSLPRNAKVSNQRLKFVLSNSAQPLFSEFFYGLVLVNENLLSASIENLNNGCVLGEKAVFDLVLNNDSIAEHSVLVESDLPGYWFAPVEVSLKPFEAKSVVLEVVPYSYGGKDFSFLVSSELNSRSFPFKAGLNVSPTLPGMFRASLAGFPFFSPGFLPQYLLNGFLSLVG